MEVGSLPLGRRSGARLRRTRRWFEAAASVTGLLGIAVLATAVVGLAIGYRPLIVRSGSMEPTIRTGDLIVVRQRPPAALRRGEVVSFHDPSRAQELVSHRVVRVRERGARYFFVTRGDANTAVERWSVAAHGSVGELAFRVPKAGYAVAVFTVPAVRFAVLSLAALLLGGLVVRRIWTTPE
jgi:signal peptidase